MATKAFLSGINDYKTIGDLRGCVNDTQSVRRLLIEEFHFDDSQIRVRTDKDVTKPELNKGWKWLLKSAEPGDRLVFHFSGHGSYTVDLDSDEPDRRDELLCLYGMDWNDSKTYLLDDEVRKWTKQIPDGVSVTFLMDCCHSGTNTRFLEPPMSRAAKTDFRSASSLSLDDVAAARVGAQSRSGTRPNSVRDVNEGSVLARFAPPPVEVQVAIDKAKRKSSFRDLLTSTRSRSADDSTMNHVLWSGCRDDQTSADAFIDGDFHGAFTFHFCDTIRTEGASSSRVISKLRETLKGEHFDQVPQLEPSDTDGWVFGSSSGAGSSAGKPAPGEPIGGSVMPTSDQFQVLISTLQQIAAQLGGGLRAGVGGAQSAGRSLLYVHGICRHDAGYSNDWWEAMSPHLSPGVRLALAANRHEVLWSRHVTQIDRALTQNVDLAEQRQIELTLQAILQERVTKEVDEQIAENARKQSRSGEMRSAVPEGPMPRAVLGIPGLDCVDDFVKYLTIEPIRQAVIGEFTSKLIPLLRRGDSVEVISHSWGTVVAYEALRSLDRSGLSGRVHNWFTVGAALAISYIARQLRPSDGQKPTMVDRWINLDARGDGVGGSVQATGMQVDREYLRLEPMGCNDLFGLVSPACAHSSYFTAGNEPVNRDIFANWIERT